MSKFKINFMKKIVFLLLTFCTITSVYSQKKKKASQRSNATVLATTGNISAEIWKQNIILCINKKDTIIIKPTTIDAMPINCKITAFKTKGTELHLVTWTEVIATSDPKKAVVATSNYSKIYNILGKTEVGTNIKTVTKTTEQVQLGKSTATETQEKIKTEGQELALLPNGDIVLKSKKGDTKYTYDTVDKKFK